MGGTGYTSGVDNLRADQELIPSDWSIYGNHQVEFPNFFLPAFRIWTSGLPQPATS